MLTPLHASVLNEGSHIVAHFGMTGNVQVGLHLQILNFGCRELAIYNLSMQFQGKTKYYYKRKVGAEDTVWPPR